MATHDKETEGKFELSRRDFLKAGAAAAVVGATGADMVFTASRALAADVAATYQTTCPYCSAQCGQLVDVDASNNVLDIYGDWNNPTNRGGLCSKGAGAFQLVNNVRRLGVPEHTDTVDGFDFTGTAWKRVGNGGWSAIALDDALTEIVQGDAATTNLHTGLKAIRDSLGAVTPGDDAASNAKTVMFFGSSHMNNEGNYIYRKLIAEFGTSLVEQHSRTGISRILFDLLHERLYRPAGHRVFLHAALRRPHGVAEVNERDDHEQSDDLDRDIENMCVQA